MSNVSKSTRYVHQFNLLAIDDLITKGGGVKKKTFPKSTTKRILRNSKEPKTKGEDGTGQGRTDWQDAEEGCRVRGGLYKGDLGCYYWNEEVHSHHCSPTPTHDGGVPGKGETIFLRCREVAIFFEVVDW
ncbi:hypothetical protein L2E82_01055 [Cichorium intybus]|uniref:Uncharacterized protein n=1 Tax=Cichorium intybus TaxID=13427 RepID=A0ACB9GXR8_CICIN|nr:hypothetical protein L2E82_01055 [Cichorium intybus]